MKLTTEYFESAGITISQPEVGVRYGEESLALAEFCTLRSFDLVAELCSGVGVISLILAAKKHPSRVVCVEIQKELHEIALANVEKNGFNSIVECVNEDYRKFADDNPKTFDVVVANPPFYALGTGRTSSDRTRFIARHEVSGTLSELLASARKILKPEGRFFIVMKSERAGELTRMALFTGFELTRDRTEGEIHLAEFYLK